PPPHATPLPYTTLFRSSSVGASSTSRNRYEPKNLPSTMSASPTGAVIIVSIVPVAHSCASRPIERIGTTRTSSQTIHSKMVRMRSEEHTSELQSLAYLV